MIIRIREVLKIREALNLIKRIIINKYKSNIFNNSKIEQVHNQNFKKYDKFDYFLFILIIVTCFHIYISFFIDRLYTKINPYNMYVSSYIKYKILCSFNRKLPLKLSQFNHKKINKNNKNNKIKDHIGKS